MSQLRQNILANLVGRGCSALMALAFVPAYIHFMGIEAYGLVGFFVTLQAILSLLDLGLSTTLNRELARLSVQEGERQEARDLVRTFEMIYWVGASAIALVVVLLAPVIAHHWIRSQGLSAGSVGQAVLIMGLAIAVAFPFAVYSGGLLGLQRQVLLNTITVAMTTLRGVGAVLILWLVSPTIEFFLGWQAFVFLAQTALTGLFLWRSLPKTSARPQFRRSLVLRRWRFAAGITGISILATLLLQVDKLVLSTLLTLEMFGYYTLAGLVGSGLLTGILPIFSAVFPRLCQLVSVGDEEGVKTLYHRSSQLISVVVIPAAVVVALFARDILLIWTGDARIVAEAHVLVSLLVIGSALNGLNYIPYALQLAYGWTSLAFYENLVGVILLIPLTFWATRSYGAVGAAVLWIVLNAGYIFVGIHVMHAQLMKSEKLRWYYQDVGLPVVGVLMVALPGRWLFPEQAPASVKLTWLLLISVLTLAACAWVAPSIRDWLRKTLAPKGFSILRHSRD